MKYRIYYGDGSTFDGPVRFAPEDNVQAIVFNDDTPNYRNTGRTVLHSLDFYIFSDEVGWHGTDKYADIIEHVNCHTVKRVLRGRWIPRADWHRILDRAEKDPDFSRRTAVEHIGIVP